MTDDASSRSHRVELAIALVLAALVLALYGRTAWFGYLNYDDGPWVYANATVAQGVTLDGLARAFDTPVIGHWAPLITISHLVVAQVAGTQAAGHHLGNVLIHAGAVVALFVALRRLTDSTWRSAVVAAIFALHPLNCESVAWITERKTVLSGLFFFLGIGAYARWVRHRRSGKQYALLLLWFACGLMAKQSVVTLPVVLLLLDYWPLGRVNRLGDWPRLMWEKAPLFLLAAIGSALAVVFQRSSMMSLEAVPLQARIANAIVSYAIYVRQIFWPTNLAVFNPQSSADLSALCVWSSVALLLGITLIVVLARSHRYLTVGWLWFLGVTFPLIGLFQVGEVAHADRYMYLPIVGVIAGLTWAVADFIREWPARRTIGVVAATVVLGLTAWAGWHQVSTWRTPETVWQNAIAKTKRNYIAHLNLAAHYTSQQRIDEAIQQLEACLVARPDYPDALSALGGRLSDKGDFARSIPLLQRAAELDPKAWVTLSSLGVAYTDQGRIPDALATFEKGLRVRRDEPLLLSQYANALVQAERIDEAKATYEKCVRLDPGLPPAHIGLGQLHFQRGEIREALHHFQRALELAPNSSDAHCGLGDVRFQQGAVADAIDHYRQSLRSGPGNVTAQANLAWILATSPDPAARSPQEALSLAQAASEATGNQNPVVLRILAAAKAEAGDFAGAVATISQAQRLARAMGDPGLAARLENHLAIYQQGAPLRTAPNPNR